MRGTPPGMPYAWNPKSRPSAEKREGAGVGLPGTGSPRRIWWAFEMKLKSLQIRDGRE